MHTLALRFLRDEDGQDIIEYALLGSFISIVAIAAVTAVGLDVDRLFGLINTALG